MTTETPTLGRSHEFLKVALVSFTIPAIIRAIPELIAYPYPLGFDTVTAYLTKMTSQSMFQQDMATLLKRTNLYYILQELLYYVIKDPILTLKILGPLLYGLLFLSIGIYAYTVYKTSPKNITVGISIMAISILALRLGWDLYRNMLGLSLAITTLTLLHMKGRWRSLAIITSFLTAFAHELATVFLGISIFSMLLVEKAMQSKSLDTYKVPTLLVAGFTFTYQRLDITSLSLNIPFKVVWITKETPILINILSVYVFLALPLLIPTIIILKRIKEVELKVWLLASILFSLTPLFGVYTTIPYRFILMLVFPISISIVLFFRYIAKFHSFNNLAFLILMIYVMFSGAFYVVSTPYNTFSPTFFIYKNISNLIAKDFPLGYLQNTMALEDIGYLNDIIFDFHEKNLSNSKLILPSIFEWIRFYRNISLLENKIVFYDFVKIGYFSSEIKDLPINSSSYILWWKDGDWYGIDPSKTFGFQIYSKGTLALYEPKIPN